MVPHNCWLPFKYQRGFTFLRNSHVAINESHVRQRQLGLSGFHGPVPGIFGMFLPWSELEGMFGILLVGHFLELCAHCFGQSSCWTNAKVATHCLRALAWGQSWTTESTNEFGKYIRFLGHSEQTVPFEVIVSWGSGARFGITETAKMLPRGLS